MDIFLKNLEKRFNREQIFKKLNHHFEANSSTAIIGPNGSGKSTLLQIIAGSQPPSNGEVVYQQGGADIEVDNIYQHISLAAPYLELIEEFTLQELMNFHFKFKKHRSGETIASILEKAYLIDNRNKIIKNFSSGMKQRLKLMLAFFSDTPILLLDEPTSNMDKKGEDWYQHQITLITDRTVVVASNQPYEYTFCQETIDLNQFK